jgi:serine/threonine protein kinase
MKVVRKGQPSKQKKTTLSREIECLKVLDHPNIVELHEVINDENNPNLFLIMQYLDGPDIENLSGTQ